MCEYSRLPDYKTKSGYTFNQLFAQCKDLFSESDYVVANLETPIAGEHLKYSYKEYNFNTPEQILYDMRSSGITMVTTANNHVLDRGLEGINNTIKNIKNAGLDYTGTSPYGKRSMPLIKIINGVKIAFLSYTYGTEACYNMNYLSKKDMYRVNLFQNQELYNPIIRFVVRNNSIAAKGIRYIVKLFKPYYFKRNIEDYPQSSKRQRKTIINDLNYCKKNKVDLTVVCLHSGGQFNEQPTDLTKKVSRYFINHGADLIVGNHEHLIQGSQLKGTKYKIAYCLGNFSSNYSIDRPPFDKDAQCSIVLHTYLSKTNCFHQRYAFTVMISIKQEDGIIVTKPLYNEWIDCSDIIKKKHLEELNLNSVNRFMSKKITSCEPKIEYEYDEFF